MRNLLAILLTTTILMSLGCSKRVVLNNVALCPKPTAPQLKELDGSLDVASIENISTMIDNSLKDKLFKSQLLATVKCYEDQINGHAATRN